MALKFNNEVNIGHLISLVGMFGMMTIGWMALSGRVTAAEVTIVGIQARMELLERSSRQNKEDLMKFLQDFKIEIKQDVRDLRNTVEKGKS